MVPAAGQSIYYWMYRQGLQQRPIEDVISEALLAGHDIRNKDYRNYWNGWYRHDLHFSRRDMLGQMSAHNGPMAYGDYPDHPYLGQPEIQNCFVPCSKDNRPLIRWGRGTMTLADAEAWPGCVYLAENMMGAQRIVIDVDGDHGGQLDIDAIRFFDRYREMTCCHEKPDIVLDVDEGPWDLHTACLPTSYHLTFGVTKVIPTMHFPKAHVDIVGNQRNSLRYFKNKRYNGLPPLMMDDKIWLEITDYIERRQHS